MPRLTFEGNFCDIAMCRENPCPYNGMCSQRQTWERLEEYEDTGLEPEDVRRLQKEWTSLIMKLDEMGGMPHLSDLLQAERDGRLVVLPCGEDAELERDGHRFIADHWSHTLTAFRDEPKNKSGKQIALFSTKAAAAALKGGTHEDSGGL